MIGVITPEPGVVEVRDLPEPAIEDPTDVIIEVKAAAICGSDLHIKDRRIPKVKPDVVLGHEFVGRIVEVGGAVKDLKVGQRVTAPPAYWCGHCSYCRKDLPQYCKRGGVYGYSTHGAQARYMRVLFAENCLTVVPDEVSDEEAVLVGDVLQTGFHAAHQGGITPGDVVVVFGCGPIGIGAIISAWLFGPKAVIAVDVIPARLDLARRYGAEAIDASKVDPAEAIRELTGGEGADVVIDAAGSPGVLRAALKALRRGGKLSVVGIYGSPVEFPAHKFSQYGIELKMGLGYLGWTQRLMELVAAKRVDLLPLITHRFPLQDAPSAYELCETKKAECLKVILKP